MKTCSKCSKNKPEEQFRRRKIVPSGRCGVCKECEKEQRKQWNIKNYKKDRAAVKRYRNKHRAYFLIKYAQKRATKLGIAFDLDLHREEIQKRIDNGICELSGIRLSLDGSRSFNTPSIDRIDPNKGYVYKNIRIICFAMNCALCNWGEDVLYATIISWINKRNSKRADNGRKNDGTSYPNNQSPPIGVI